MLYTYQYMNNVEYNINSCRVYQGRILYMRCTYEYMNNVFFPI
jgi:hypothetical protein